MDLQQVLRAAGVADLATRTEAERQLQVFEERDYPNFLLQLVAALANDALDVASRQLAGLVLKNSISAQDLGLQQQKEARWASMPPQVQQQLQNGLLTALTGQAAPARTVAAQAIAAFGAVDLPAGRWQNLLTTLLNFVVSPEAPDGTKVASLDALGFLCDEMDTGAMAPEQVNNILTAIVDGMQPHRSVDIQRSAIKAMRNSLEFAEQNFQNEGERNMIMQMACQGTQSPDETIRKTAYECIAMVASLYYEYLPAYIETIFQLTSQAIAQDAPEVGMQAIEVWSTICDCELEHLAALDEDEDLATAEDFVFHRIIEQAAEPLVNIMLATLTQQDEEADEDTWNIAMAGATCLALIAEALEDNVVPLTLPFVTSNVQSPEWRQREAALMAFGSIMEGPSVEVMGPYVQGSLQLLLTSLNDTNDLVKDTAAWTLARICELHSESVPAESFTPVVEALYGCLSDPSAKVASQACFALYCLAGAVPGEGATNMLSPVTTVLVGKLFETTVRPDHDEHNLRAAAYETIGNIVAHSAADSLPVVGKVLEEIINRLSTTVGGDRGDATLTHQVELCGVVYECVQKLGDQITPHANALMQLLLQVLSNRGAAEDAIMVIGQIADKLGAAFEGYMPAFQPALGHAVMNMQEYQVCAAAVGVIGDLCRALEGNIATYSDDWVHALLQLLQAPDLNRTVKPAALAVFADIALALNGGFTRYVQAAMTMLQQASQLVLPDDATEEAVEYMNSLRESILEAYTGILQGLREDNQQGVISPYVDGVMHFIKVVAEDDRSTSDVKKSLIGLIGDIGHCFQRQAAGPLRQPFIMNMLNEALQDEESQQVARWAMSIISQLK